MFEKLILAVILSSISCVLAEQINSSPLLILSNPESDVTYDKSGLSSTLSLSEAELRERIKIFGDEARKMILIFPDMGPEDFRLKNDDQESSFANVAKYCKIHDYWPSVKSSVETLMSTAENKITVELLSNNEFDRDVTGYSTIFVRLPDCRDGESRFRCMARADDIIYALTQQSKNDVFFVTSITNSRIQTTLSRKTRAAGSNDEPHAFKHGNLFAYYLSAWEHPKKENAMLKQITIKEISAKSGRNEYEMDVSMRSETYEIVLHLFSSTGSWSSLNASVNGQPVMTQTLIGAPMMYSFKCSSGIYFKFAPDAKPEGIDGISVRGLQLQPRFGAGEDIKRFEPAVECVGFTSSAIWAGLFVTFLLLTILTVGITFILDIRTMDRFDDPKGKTITVIASE